MPATVSSTSWLQTNLFVIRGVSASIEDGLTLYMYSVQALSLRTDAYSIVSSSHVALPGSKGGLRCTCDSHVCCSPSGTPVAVGESSKVHHRMTMII